MVTMFLHQRIVSRGDVTAAITHVYYSANRNAGTAYANGIYCIVAPSYTDFDIDTQTYIWSQSFSSAENPDFMPARNLPPLNHQDIEFYHKMIAWRHTGESSSSARSHHPDTSSGWTELRNRWGPPLGTEAR